MTTDHNLQSALDREDSKCFNPPVTDLILPAPNEIAEAILNGADINYVEWSSVNDRVMAEAFTEILARITSFDYDNDFDYQNNRAYLMREIQDYIEKTLTSWAERR